MKEDPLSCGLTRPVSPPPRASTEEGTYESDVLRTFFFSFWPARRRQRPRAPHPMHPRKHEPTHAPRPCAVGVTVKREGVHNESWI